MHLGLQHDNNLGKEGATYYDELRTTRIHILLEDYTDTYGRSEKRMAAYQLDDAGEPGQRIGYLPTDAPRQTGNFVAQLHRPANKKGERGRIEGTLAPLREY